MSSFVSPPTSAHHGQLSDVSECSDVAVVSTMAHTGSSVSHTATAHPISSEKAAAKVQPRSMSPEKVAEKLIQMKLKVM